MIAILDIVAVVAVALLVAQSGVVDLLASRLTVAAVWLRGYLRRRVGGSSWAEFAWLSGTKEPVLNNVDVYPAGESIDDFAYERDEDGNLMVYIWDVPGVDTDPLTVCLLAHELGHAVADHKHPWWNVRGLRERIRISQAVSIAATLLAALGYLPVWMAAGFVLARVALVMAVVADEVLAGWYGARLIKQYSQIPVRLYWLAMLPGLSSYVALSALDLVLLGVLAWL